MKTREYYLLLALAGGARHGLAMARDVERLSDRDIKLWPATLYGTLEELIELWTRFLETLEKLMVHVEAEVGKVHARRHEDTGPTARVEDRDAGIRLQLRAADDLHRDVAILAVAVDAKLGVRSRAQLAGRLSAGR